MRESLPIEPDLSAGGDPARLTVTYQIEGAGRAAEALARRIAFEQTVELPEHLIVAPEIRDEIVGRVEQVEPDPIEPGRSRARLSFDEKLSGYHLAQLLNLCFGNASMYPGVRVVDLALGPGFLARMAGPKHGVEGLRALLGVYDRPLLATALKPRGLAVAELAGIAGAFARGGGDIVKDDQNLVDDFTGFRRRVQACRDAVARANDGTGRRCLYFPHASAPPSELERQLEFTARLGLSGVLVCPIILGLETTRSLGDRYGLVMMGHPALSGSYFSSPGEGFSPELLLGTLFRLAGIDVSIYPNAGGRFALTAGQCAAIRDRLRAPLGRLGRTWPCPAGGMGYDDLPKMGRESGQDAVFLVGGSLFGHGHDLTSSTRAFLDRVREGFTERLETPVEKYHDSAGGEGARREYGGYHLEFLKDFQWRGRESSPYKDSDRNSHRRDFQGVRRVELVGKFAEGARFDLRYFEVEPGGHSSRESHLHPHVILAARGHGVLVLGNERIGLALMDVAYVEPLQIHQLINETPEPFGFFCMVDHERDRPWPEPGSVDAS